MRDSGGCRKAACCDGRVGLGVRGFAGDFLLMAYPLSVGLWPLTARVRGQGEVLRRVCSAKDSVLANGVEHFE